AGRPFWGAVSARLIEYSGEEVIVSYSRDLTKQLAVEAELTRQREQLFQNEKMSALGELLAGVAHELNNPLSVVVGHSMMLKDETDDPEILRQTAKISDAAERCARIVKTFLTMARQEPAKKEPLDINGVLATAIDVARYGESAAEVEIRSDFATDLGAVNGDGDQITQAILNLLLNAEQAIGLSGEGDTIRVMSRRKVGGDRVEITVEDNGPGIRPELRARVFEPFFTTKDIGKGTGIGLAFCHRVIQSHGGTIDIDPAFRGGTRFVVTLPFDRATEPEAPAPEIVKSTPAMRRLLVIDDESDVADLNAEVLERAGYDVDVAYAARDALAMMAGRAYDAVISDLNMPDIDGRGFFEAIRADYPELVDRTGFVTGDTMGKSSQTFLREAGRSYLEKPVSPAELRDFAAALVQGERE
ncbi:MAG: ATP-binding protein, partial [Pseudomonadota bacterium]